MVSSSEFLRSNFCVQLFNFSFSRQIAREQAEKVSAQVLHAESIIDASKVPSCSDTASTAAPTGLLSHASENLAPTSDWMQTASVPANSSPVENVDQVQLIAEKTPELGETDDSSVTVTKTSAATLY